jgi:hypothetical protein
MKSIKILLVACAVTLLAGCKVAVMVVEGGEVQSIASGTCLVGDVCIHEVLDTNYSEEFTAVADARGGWHFVKWNSGGDFLCENSTDPVCVVSNAGTAGHAIIEGVVASDQTFYIMPIFRRLNAPTPIYEDGQVIGVNGLVVDGESWDVTFEDGSFNSNYPQPFTMLDNLTDLVFALGDFIYYGGTGLERTPAIFRGCSGSECNIATPASDSPGSYRIFQLTIGSSFHYSSESKDGNTTYHDVTYAHWELSPVSTD